MSRKSVKSAKSSNIGRRFILFVKTVDDDGFVVESECGWLSTVPQPQIVFSMDDAFVFVEKEEGHGSPSDWKKFFEEENPNWKINPPKYVD